MSALHKLSRSNGYQMLEKILQAYLKKAEGDQRSSGMPLVGSLGEFSHQKRVSPSFSKNSGAVKSEAPPPEAVPDEAHDSSLSTVVSTSLMNAYTCRDDEEAVDLKGEENDEDLSSIEGSLGGGAPSVMDGSDGVSTHLMGGSGYNETGGITGEPPERPVGAPGASTLGDSTDSSITSPSDGMIEDGSDDLACAKKESGNPFKLPSEFIDKRDDFGRTALHLASFEGHLESAKILIKYGADVRALAKNAMTCLHFAVQKGHLEVAKLLCKKGANISSRTSSGCVTPLHLAMENGHTECALFLIQRGATQRYNKKGKVPLELASQETVDAIKEALGEKFERFEKSTGKRVEHKETVKFYKKKRDG